MCDKVHKTMSHAEASLYWSVIRDLFHVYLNRCDFTFFRLHINKKHKVCFLVSNGRVPSIAK